MGVHQNETALCCKKKITLASSLEALCLAIICKCAFKPFLQLDLIVFHTPTNSAPYVVLKQDKSLSECRPPFFTYMMTYSWQG